MSLSSLPTEIHHEIFSHLDYVGDICAHPILFHSSICTSPSTSKEFDELIDSDDYLEFDLPPEQPLFLTCKSILNSFKSFQPTILNLGVRGNKKKCFYQLDVEYFDGLGKYRWFDNDASRTKDVIFAGNSGGAWRKFLMDFIRKMKRLCKINPFRRVELVSLSQMIGRNYSSGLYRNYNFTGNDDYESNICELFGLLPELKYFQCNINPQACLYLKSRLKDLHIFTYISVDQQDNINKKLPSRFQRNLEILLYNSVRSPNIQEAKFILENFSIDINRFSHIWNIQASDYHHFTNTNFPTILDTLQEVYLKYPTFKVFRLPIFSLECLQIIKKYPFIHINVGRNITKRFLSSILGKKDSVAVSFCEQYNVDLSRLGKYNCSIACLMKNYFEKSKTPLNLNTQDSFGVTPCMLLTNTVNTKPDINIKDKFGNNILHYYHAEYALQIYAEIPILKQLTKKELTKLSEEPNHFGVSPKEIAFSKNDRRYLTNNCCKKFNYEGLVRTCGAKQNLLLLDGLQVDMRILFATINTSKHTYNYEEYLDINYRDVNGKHLVHYLDNCFRIPDSLITLPLREILFCMDNDQNIPLHTCSLDYYSILHKLSELEDLPFFDFIGNPNRSGMYRIMFQMLKTNLDVHSMILECNTVGFDYSTGIPQIISLNCHFSEGCFLFSLERSILKQLHNVTYFGSVEGDDISHFIIRCYIDIIKKYTCYLDHSILKILIKKGLKFNIVRNSQGKTAFDLLEEFKGSLIATEKIQKLKKTCRRGTTRSKALNKFSIIHDPVPLEFMVEKSDNLLIVKSRTFRARVRRSLYFEAKPQTN